MNKGAVLLLLFLLVLVVACSVQTPSGEMDIETPLDSDVDGLSAESSDLNESDLEELDSDLEAIENL